MSETVSFRSRSIAKKLEEQDGEWDVDGMQTNSRGKMEPSRIQMKRSKHGLDKCRQAGGSIMGADQEVVMSLVSQHDRDLREL